MTPALLSIGTVCQFYQAAQDWQQWGGQMAQAGMSLMNAGLLGGAGGAAEAAGAAEDPGAMGVAAKWLSKGDVTTPITAVGGIQTPNQIDPSLPAGNFTDKYLAKEGYYGQRAGQNLGGLRGIKYNDRGVPVIG